jgi:hypothetical protein
MRVLGAAGLVDELRWMAVWRKHWDANLATCVDGECLILLS